MAASANNIDRNRMKPTLELKRQAVKYYNENNVPKCLEELLNKMFLDNPKDIYGYMAEYFSSKSKTPTISRIDFQDVLSNRGCNTLLCTVFCEINGLEKFVMDIVPFFDDGPKLEISKVKSKPATGSKSKSDKKSVTAQLSTAINQSDAFLPKSNVFDYDVVRQDIARLSEKLIGQGAMKQPDMDIWIKTYCDAIAAERTEHEKSVEASEQTMSLEKPMETPCNDCLRKTRVNYAELYLSLTTAQLASALDDKMLYESLRNSYFEGDQDPISIPTPMVLLMKCGTDSIGKLNLFKGVYLVPKLQKPLFEGFQKLSLIYKELGHLLHQKLGINGRLVNADGSYSPGFERPDQVFEFLHNAAVAVNCNIPEDFDMILDIGASYFYDEEKKKYEVSAGNFRTTEDLLMMYADFVEKHPIIGIIDGISHKDIEGCSELNRQLSGKCFCFGDKMLMENVDLIEDHIENQACNGIIIRLGNYFNNLTELHDISKLIKGKNCAYVMMNATAQGCSNHLAPDLATAFGATFVAVGPPTHIENINVYNRLIEIEKDLRRKEAYRPKECYDFPLFKEDLQESQTADEELAVKDDTK